jgi:SAM-dependent methyltransferase
MEKLILGCGKHHVKRKNEVTVDILKFPCVDIVTDLNLDWPFEDSSVDSIAAIHLVEHLDSLIHFMNESWRVLKPGGSLYLETPLAGGDIDLAWADPTHKRCYRIHTFVNYFSIEGIEQFGYTDKAWNFFHLNVINNCIIVHAYPLKK